MRVAIDHLGYVKATAVQTYILSRMSSKVNIYAISPSGTGKTVAMILSMLNNIDQSKNIVQSMMICVTFEAAYQAHKYALEIIERAGMEINVCLARSDKSPWTTACCGTCHAIIGSSHSEMQPVEVDGIKEIYLDDGDVKITEKLISFIKTLPSTRIILASSTSNTNSLNQLTQFGAIDQLKLPKHQWFNKNVKHCFIVRDDNFSPKEKLYMMGEILRLMKEKCPTAQGLIYCQVL